MSLKKLYPIIVLLILLAVIVFQSVVIYEQQLIIDKDLYFQEVNIHTSFKHLYGKSKGN